MIGLIVKEITKRDKDIYNELGDKVYPLELPEKINELIPSAIYKTFGLKDKNQVGERVYDEKVYFLIMADTYANSQRIEKKIVKGVLNSNYTIGEMDGIRINYVNVVDSDEMPNDKFKDVCGIELYFNFNYSLE